MIHTSLGRLASRCFLVLLLAALSACGGGDPLSDIGNEEISSFQIGGGGPQALSVPVWYIIADAGGGGGGNDWLLTVDTALAPPASNTQSIGAGTGTNNIEACAFWPGTDILYATNADRLGTVNTSTGVFTGKTNIIGTGNGAAGNNIAMNDVDGLTFDPFTAELYGTQRRTSNDLLIKIDPVSGQIIKDAFGTGVDYVVIQDVQSGNDDIDDIAIDPDDRVMYGVANSGGNNDRLVRIDPLTGTATDVGILGALDIEGFSFYNDGGMWGTTGATATLYQINTDIGMAFNGRPITIGGDHESLTFLTADLNRIEGTVYLDGNGNQANDGETGTPGVEVHLWRDADGDGQITPNTDTLLVTTTTDASGDYDFEFAAYGDFVITTDTNTLPTMPAQHMLTTDNLEAASFAGFGLTESGNDFGHRPPPLGTLGDRIWWDSNSDGVQDLGEAGMPGITVNLTGSGGDGTFGDGNEIVFPATVTDGAGTYSFQGLPDDTYRVDVDDTTLPAGMTLTSTGDPLTRVVALASSDLSADFGYVGDQRIGDTVFRDTDGNGLQDAGELGIPGVTVRRIATGLDNVLGTADDVVVTRTTDANGKYLFQNTPVGVYRMDVDETTLPVGLQLTSANEPFGIALALGQSRLDADFGYALLGSIGDLVWTDTNGSGIQDGGETGIAGADVYLDDAGPDGVCGTADDAGVAVQTTGATGAYDFTGLLPRRYCVRVDPATLPAGLSPTTNPNQVDLTDGLDFDDADFGYVVPNSSIGDRVWRDVDGDTVQDVGEPGLGGVTVTLINAGTDATFGTADDVTQTRVTDGSGSYVFSPLVPGLYRVDVNEATLPAGVVLTTGNEPFDITLPTSTARVDADFGYLSPATIGDVVWQDDNVNGLQDGTEPGLPSVDVILDDAGPDGLCGTPDDLFVARQTTGATGTYSFTGQLPGRYCVRLDPATVPAGLAYTSASTFTVDVLEGTTDLTSDFGLAPASAQIGDTVWGDTDENGLVNGAETGLSGVTVNLIGAGLDGTFATADDTSASRVTDASGNYLFSSLLAGLYRVDVDESTLPTGYSLTTANEPFAITLGAGATRLDADFGYAPGGTIGDLVWNDANGNGMREGTEAGLGGIDVLLEGPGIDGLCGTPDDVFVARQTTSAAGAYTHGPVARGTYCVRLDPATIPAGMIATTPASVTVSLPSGGTITTADFGLILANGSIGDTVFRDTNGDGTQNGAEAGIAGVTVNLIGDGPDNIFGTADDTSASQVTTGTGNYVFNGLIADTYRVDIVESTLPAGVNLTTSNEPLDLTLPAGGTRLDADFGYAAPGTIGDLVFTDTNANGIQDGSESGLAGVDVILDGPGLDGICGTADDVFLARQSPSAAGAYAFTGLAPARYCVRLDLTMVPAGTVVTSPTAYVVDLLDSGSFLTADFAVAPASSSIGDTVWTDSNGNGVQDGSEVGISGVTINLLGAGVDGLFGTADDTSASQVTNASGGYLFSGLVAGTYRVDVNESTLPVGLALTTGNEPMTLTVGSAASRLDADFGYALPGSIGDRVWRDDNANGVQEPSETTGVSGVRVIVDAAGPDGLCGTADDVLAGQQSSSATGIYSVSGLAPGRYCARLDPTTIPAGMIQTTPGVQTVDVTSGASVLTADFGLVLASGSIGDTVFRDTNGDGTQNGAEAGIAGVTVNLIGDGPDNVFGTADDTSASQVTTGTGNYVFNGLIADTYRVDIVEATLPAGVALTSGNEPLDLTLPAGGTRLDADFGYAAPGTIGDLVFTDTNANGIQDGSESGLAGVDVILDGPGPDGICGTADDVFLARQSPSAAGAYAFTGLAPARYCVRLDLTMVPAGTVVTSPTAYVVDLLDSGSFLTADFAVAPASSSIGDTVWTDSNGNGVQDGSEVGIGAVTINLLGAGVDGLFGTADDTSASQVTNASGGYLFSGLVAGTYRVDVNESTLPVGLALTTGNEPMTLALGSAASRLDADFGYALPGSIGDRVWRDDNANGVQEPSETAGVSGVRVIVDAAGPDGLCGTADDVLAGQQSSSATGIYSVSGLAPGRYCARLDPTTIPAGMIQTTPGVQTVDVTSGASVLTADFGLILANGSIGDTVFRDTNGDGTQNGAEAGIAGVTVNLIGDGPDNIFGTADDTSASQVTTGTGNYVFNGLIAETYRVDIVEGTLPAGVALTSGNEPLDLTLPAGGTRLDADFGYAAPGTIGDLVFTDTNANGIQDGSESGLAGVDVILDGPGPDGICGTADDVFLARQSPAATGAYALSGLAPARYCVRLDLTMVPAGTVVTSPTAYVVDLLDGGSFLTADFAVAPASSSIGDTVWTDSNGNGVQDGSEVGISGVTINLLGAGVDGLFGTADDTNASQVTNASGGYLFTGLTAGLYNVSVLGSSLPAGLLLTTGNEPMMLALGSAAARLDADFGYALPGSVGDRVWRDDNANGVQEPSETIGVAGVDVIVDAPGPDGLCGTADDIFVARDTTNASGNYAVTGLAPGMYCVRFDMATLPANNSLTTPGSLTANITSGAMLTTADYGLVLSTASIGDRVWADDNGNGIQDAGEVGIPGLTVELRAAPGGVCDLSAPALATQMTALDGGYDFTGLLPGEYCVRVDPASVPGDLVSTTPNPAVVVLAAGEDHDLADIGLTMALYTVGDRVYLDSDGDGTYEPEVGERPFQGVRVVLCDALGNALGTTLTDAEGKYVFVVSPGNYQVKIDDNNFQSGGLLAGLQNMTGGNVSGATVTADRDDLDFGYRGSSPGTAQFCSWWTDATSWPVAQLSIAGIYYQEAALRALLNEGNLLDAGLKSRTAARLATTADMTVLVSWAMIGAKLNVASGNASGGIEATIRAADAWIVSVGGLRAGITRYAQAQAYAAGDVFYRALTDYNAGR